MQAQLQGGNLVKLIPDDHPKILEVIFIGSKIWKYKCLFCNHYGVSSFVLLVSYIKWSRNILTPFFMLDPKVETHRPLLLIYFTIPLLFNHISTL